VREAQSILSTYLSVSSCESVIKLTNIHLNNLHLFPTDFYESLAKLLPSNRQHPNIDDCVENKMEN